MKRDEGGAPFFDELAQGVHSGAISRREAIKLGGSALAVAALAGLFPSRAEALRRTVALKLYYSQAREDNFTTATQAGKQSAIDAGYQKIRTEGYVFPKQRPGTVPLKLYYSQAREDNFTTATQQGEQSAIDAGYQFIRIEGYVFPNRRRGTVPLKLYYSQAREDNFTTATQQGKQSAIDAGYQFIRNEGYVYRTRR
jgi:ethanolamine utilization microcompartment shell protein EutL